MYRRDKKIPLRTITKWNPTYRRPKGRLLSMWKEQVEDKIKQVRTEKLK